MKIAVAREGHALPYPCIPAARMVLSLGRAEQDPAVIAVGHERIEAVEATVQLKRPRSKLPT